MKKSKFTEEQILQTLRQVEAGTTAIEMCRKLGISEQTFFTWRRKFAGLGVAELRRLKQLEEENRKLKQLVADLTLDKTMLQARPRYGYRRLHVLLRREGWHVNIKRVWRQYKQLGLNLRGKVGRKKRASQPRVEPARPVRPGQQWCMDFVSDEFVSGQRFRILTVVDIFSRSSEIFSRSWVLPEQE